MSVCPKCQHPLQAETVECERCGVILDKARSPARPTLSITSSRSTTRSGPGKDREPIPQWQALSLPAFLVLAFSLAWITSILIGRHQGTQVEIEAAPETEARTGPGEASDEPQSTASRERPTSPDTAPDSSEGQPSGSSIQRLLDRQALAALGQSAEAFLETFHSQRQESALYLYDVLQSLPLSSYRQVVNSEDPSELLLQQWLEFEGMADRPFLFTRPIEVMRESNELRVSRIGKPDAFVLWEQEPIEVTRTNHFLVFTHPSHSAIRTEVVGVIESAWLALYQRYLPMADRYAAFVPGDPAYFGRMSGNSLVAGVATWRYLKEQGQPPRVINPALYLNPILFRRGVNPDIRLQALMHEMVHLALSDDTHEKTPNWLIEGSAVHFSGGYTQGGEAAKLGRVLDRMSVQRAKVLSTVEEYAYAGAAVEYLIDGRDVHHFLAFFRAVKHDQGRIDAALDRFYGVSPATLDEELKEWLAAMHRFRS